MGARSSQYQPFCRPSSAQVLFDLGWHRVTSKYAISCRLAIGVEIKLGERIDNGSIVYKTWRIYRIESSRGELGVSSLMSARPDA